MSSMTKSFLKVFGASGLLAMIASQSFAQDAPALVPTDSVFILNSLLFLIGGFLVFWMAAGFTSAFKKRDNAIDEKYGSIFVGSNFLLPNRL